MTADDTIRTAFQRWEPDEALTAIAPMTPDASLRRYFRIHFQNSETPGTAVVTVFDSIASPEASGGGSLSSFDACTQLTKFFHKHLIPVPELYHESRDPYLLMSEDLGDMLLAHLLLREQVSPEAWSGENRALALDKLYRSAVEIIVALQQIPAGSSVLPFERSFTRSVYAREVEEFSDYVLDGNSSDGEAVQNTFAILCRELEELPQVIVHRDFHSWNLIVDPRGRLRVLDFQDALMGSRCYDIVGLLNDRDTDSALGAARYKMLLAYFKELSGAGSEFLDEYDRVLLQRDLKVAGRFRKLVKERSLAQYDVWVPGTLRRIGRTLRRLTDRPGTPSCYVSLLTILAHNIPEVLAGAEGPDPLTDSTWLTSTPTAERPETVHPIENLRGNRPPQGAICASKSGGDKE